LKRQVLTVKSHHATKYYTGPENLDRVCCVPVKVMLMENKYKRISKVSTTKAMNQWKIKSFLQKRERQSAIRTGDFVHKGITHAGKKVTFLAHINIVEVFNNVYHCFPLTKYHTPIFYRNVTWIFYNYSQF
jgi:hypothetical protein